MKHADIFTRLAQRADPNIPILEAAMAEIANLQATVAQQAERIKELEEILRGIPL